MTLIDFLFLIVIIPFFLSLFSLATTVFYARKIRGLHRRLPLSSSFTSARVDHCPLCTGQVPREQFTRVPFLFPYTFKLVRHYESSHKDISNYARRTRLSFTLFLWLTLHTFIAVVAARNVERAFNPETALLSLVPYFLVPYFSLLSIVLVIITYLLLVRKGSILERKH